MIDPVLAYYHMRLLGNMYWDENESDCIVELVLSPLIREIKNKFIGREFKTFYITDLYDQGTCRISYYKHRTEHHYIKLKDIQDI